MALQTGGGDASALLAVTGQTPGVNGSVDAVTVAFDPGTLNQVWERTFNHDPCDDTYFSIDIPVDIDISKSDRAVAVTGFTMASCGDSPADWFVAAYDSADGTPIFTATFDGPAGGDDAPVGVKIAGGKVIVGGTVTTSSGRQAVVRAYDLNSNPPGAVAWTSTPYGEAGRHVDARAMAGHADGWSAVYLTCASRPFTPGGTNANVVTIKYDAGTGAFGWTPVVAATYNNPQFDDDEPADIDACLWKMTTGPNHYHFYVAGFATRAGTGKDYLTLCYEDFGTTFPQLWSAVEDGGAGGDDRALSVSAVGGVNDIGSNAYVTGRATSSAGNFDYMTAEYRSDTSALLWKYFYPASPDGNDDLGFAVIGWGTNDCFVTGQANEGASADDCVTIRYHFNP